MRLAPTDLQHLIAVAGLLLVAAHAVGHVFRRLRQPPVIGEILGGLLLGPTVLGAIAPDAHAWLLADRPATRAVLGAAHDFGLHLLMFVSGLELRAIAAPGERRTVAAVAVAGLVVPFGLAALAFFTVVDAAPLLGPARSRGALFLVFGIAVAVASIPVISRILLDLGLMETRFARVVLATAIAEDVVLYVLLSIALSLAGAAGSGSGAGHGLPAALGLEGAGAAALAYHLVAPVALFAAALALGPAAFRRLEAHPWNLVARSSPVAFLLGFLLLLTAAALFLGVAPIFGAFLAGIVAGRAADPASPAAERRRVVIKGFSFAFFVPIYFALVGASLDLVRRFDPLFFAGFLVLACAAKLAGIYAGARAAGEPGGEAVHLAVALNARGGPGIVLASAALAGGIIAPSLYASLVLLAIVTSLLAGAWLDRRYPREARAPRPAGPLLSSRD